MPLLVRSLLGSACGLVVITQSALGSRPAEQDHDHLLLTRWGMPPGREGLTQNAALTPQTVVIILCAASTARGIGMDLNA